MSTTPATNRQIPDQSILDAFYKQTYLGNSYILSSLVDLTNTNETLILLIQNPTVANAPNLTSKAVFINLRRYTSDAQQVVIKTYINPTVATTGTASTPVNLRPASPNTSISSCYKNGQFTVSSNGTLLSSIGCSGDDYVVQDNLLLIILDPGQSMLITGTALVEDTNLLSDVSFYEL